MGDQFLDAAVEAALEAGGILRSEFGQPVKVSHKGVLDLVTEADRHSERAIVRRLLKRFPEDVVLSEEGGRQEGNTPRRWIVDPLDGTTNFVHGYPCFAVSIALEEAGELLVGVIYQPITEELFIGSKGEGAFLNEKRIHVSGIEHLSAGLIATGFPSLKRTPSPNINYYRNFWLSSQAVRRDGSSTLDLASVACGRFDGFWEFGLHPWDTAAGVLLVREAGGVVSDFSGQPYYPGDYEILVSNGHIHSEMRVVIANAHEQTAKITGPFQTRGAAEE
jgi:myo-inositol-1(or 4)-monophosphatase